MKNISLRVKKCNWVMIGPIKWVSKEWLIYDNLDVELIKETNTLNKDERITTSNYLISKDTYTYLMNELEKAKKEDKKVEAFDGVAVEVVSYLNGVEIYKRELGYIYGINTLENIVKVLENLN
jgi:hypothetical protein